MVEADKGGNTCCAGYGPHIRCSQGLIGPRVNTYGRNRRIILNVLSILSCDMSGKKKVNLDDFDKTQKEKFHDPHSGRLSFSLLYMRDSVAGAIFLCSTKTF